MHCRVNYSQERNRTKEDRPDQPQTSKTTPTPAGKSLFRELLEKNSRRKGDKKAPETLEGGVEEALKIVESALVVDKQASHTRQPILDDRRMMIKAADKHQHAARRSWRAR